MAHAAQAVPVGISQEFKPAHWPFSVTFPVHNLAVAGAVAITYPLEYLKTAAQVVPKYDPSYQKNSLQSIRNTLSERGVFGLYRGVTPFLWLVVPRTIVGVSVFEAVRPHDNKSAKQTAINGLLGGLAQAVLVSTVAENVHVKLVQDQLINRELSLTTFWQTAKDIYAQSGIKGLYTGVVPVFLRQSLFLTTQMTVYQKMLSGSGQTLDSQHGHQRLTSKQTFFASVISGFIATAVSNPFDVIKARQQALDGFKYGALTDAAKEILSKEGATAFFRGFLPNAVKASVQSLVVFSLYAALISKF
jgi:hypothetical protein